MHTQYLRTCKYNLEWEELIFLNIVGLVLVIVFLTFILHGQTLLIIHFFENNNKGKIEKLLKFGIITKFTRFQFIMYRFFFGPAS